MIEVGWLPRRRRMTIAALTGEVIRRFVVRVTGRAVDQTRVVEMRRLPGIRGVALAALTGEVIGRFVIRMA